MRAVATTEASAELMLMMEGLQKYVLEGKRGHQTGQLETLVVLTSDGLWGLAMVGDVVVLEV